ncbi:phospho-N-acetylmuramoyl-pentapeptide-transferase [Gorillibacterium massiliense]|uniref:phospho-N-acetylmuramoyl-pentapeptide- transferase n=1 Tax=Gorillibacterium massiliense TaxID=1280390 RepID=UPI0004B710AB|nr:phospho-N-acetylmuramoyl-pentapeptide-transferase [Gorillibacterium massiliense]
MSIALLVVFALTFLVVTALTPVLIRGLRALDLIQPIRAELPADHQAKRGTPLMAGLILLLGSVPTLITQPKPLALFLVVVFILFSVIGFLDDMKKAAFKDPSGISGKSKLVFQFLFTGLLLLFAINQLSITPDIQLSRSLVIGLPLAVYVGIMLIVIVGLANAINFTDGMDGLLINTAIPSYFFFFVISDKIEVRTFSLVMIACLLGLLLYNVYPARAFMGDTGSLAIGGSLTFLAVIEKVELLMPLLFLIFAVEQLSVVLQVWHYKRTKLRLFRMAPIHYHFRLKYGWSENRIVLTFGAVSWLCMLICYVLWRVLF